MSQALPVRGLTTALALAGWAATGGLPWLQVRPNRVVEGTSYLLADSAPWAAAVLFVLWVLPLALTFRKSWSGLVLPVLWATGLVVPGVLIVASAITSAALAPADTVVRVSLSWGFWVPVLLAAGATTVAGQGASVSKGVKAAGWAALVLLGLGGLVSGAFAGLSVVREYEAQADTFWAETRTHMVLSGMAVACGTLVGLGAGWGASRWKALRQGAFFVLNLVQTLPSLALFGLLLAPLSALGWGGIGPTPALLVLSLYAAFPIARSTLTALENLDRGVLDAGKGLGMGPGTLLWRVQVPLALPVVLSGIRTASVQAVGNTVVAALIGAGGLGSLIFLGLGQYAPDLILLGTLPALGLAIAVDQAWALVLTLTAWRPRR